MEIQVGKILDPVVTEALNRLVKSRDLPAKTAYRLGKISQAVFREITKAKTKRLEILREFAKKDDAGKVIEAEGKVEWTDKEALEAALGELFDSKFTVDQLHCPIDALDAAKLTPEELLAIDFVLEVQ